MCVCTRIHLSAKLSTNVFISYICFQTFICRRINMYFSINRFPPIIYRWIPTYSYICLELWQHYFCTWPSGQTAKFPTMWSGSESHRGRSVSGWNRNIYRWEVYENNTCWPMPCRFSLVDETARKPYDPDATSHRDWEYD